MPDQSWCGHLRRARGVMPPHAARAEDSGTARSDRSTADARPGPPPRVVDRADFDPSYDPSAPIVCEMCGNHMRYTAACKIQCPVCGYKRDCSDP